MERSFFWLFFVVFFFCFLLFPDKSSQAYSKYFIANATERNATCNDGSPAAYAFSNATTSPNLWLIYLEGGWLCNSLSTCNARNASTPFLMTTNGWNSISTEGIFSLNATENPDFVGGHIVVAHYCSSDLWSGSNGVDGPWVFNGRNIIQSLFEDLMNFHGLSNTPNVQVVFVGSSAGGLGILVNLEFVAKKILPNVGKLWGFCDSGFFFNTSILPNGYIPHPIYTIGEVAMPVWNTDLSSMNCSKYYPSTPYYCFSAAISLPYIQIPIFVSTHLYDQAGVNIYGSISPPNSPQTMAYDISYGITAESLICSSAANHAYFSSSCCIHTVAEKTDVFTLLVNNLNAYTVLTDWFFERNKVSHQVIEPATCYCFRGYDCNPTCSCDYGPGYQYNNCTPSTCSGNGSTTGISVTGFSSSLMTTDHQSVNGGNRNFIEGISTFLFLAILLIHFIFLN